MAEHDRICPDAILQHIASTKSLWMSVCVKHAALAALQDLLVKNCASQEGADKAWSKLGML